MSLLLAGGSPVVAGEQIVSVGGQRVGVTLVPEKPEIMLGEPATVLLTLHNYSESDLQVMEGGDYRNRLGRPDSFKVQVRSLDGTVVPQPDAGGSFGGITGPREIPAGGRYSFRLFLPHWAHFSRPGTYVMSVHRRFAFVKDGARGFARDNFIPVEVESHTSFSVVPAGNEELGKVIDALGEALLVPQDDSWPDPPARRLAAFHDLRVIPWWTRAFATRSYDLKFSALTALAEFDHADAFAVLKRGMEVRRSDLEGAAEGEAGEQYAQNIRHAAAVALSRSPHPEARGFLVSCRDDASFAVRLTVLHVLGKMPAGEAVPILEEMSADKDWRVSREAKRYLGMFRVEK